MFTKLEQQTWLKIQCARGRTAQQCHVGLVEACGDAALPYRTVARWVKTFNTGCNRVEHMPRPGRPSVSEEDIEAVSAVLDIDRRQTVCELALEIGLLHECVSHSVTHLRMRNIASRWNPPIILQDNARAHTALPVNDL
ncbi:hypothetical protein C0J52_19352 [Blattella germanica]|nr:hypothetical protein C0J52_19352 [Blattella germanica]